MITEGYLYRFDKRIDLDEAEGTLGVAIWAAEGLHGRDRVRMDAACVVDHVLHSIVIDAATAVGEDIAAIFTALLAREFGPCAFQVGRLDLLEDEEDGR